MDIPPYDQLVDDYGWLVGPAAIVVWIVVWLVVVIAYIRIIQKAGYSGWWILVALVPILNVVMFLVFAFSKWPVVREVENFRTWAHAPRPGQQPPAG
ncbi:DUF805 domain-containing protein [Oerskovia flava]|uniref:DUF805 domain-containing protein n=1 Tax=Oerskovia flava TaxID=2986422 RepID=UPI00223EFCDF|nr:DUF805 domain-containing protein [Oerskovia sp. JB1-3-2]